MDINTIIVDVMAPHWNCSLHVIWELLTPKSKISLCPHWLIHNPPSQDSLPSDILALPFPGLLLTADSPFLKFSSSMLSLNSCALLGGTLHSFILVLCLLHSLIHSRSIHYPLLLFTETRSLDFTFLWSCWAIHYTALFLVFACCFLRLEGPPHPNHEIPI